LSGWVAENRKPILNGNPSVEPGYLNNPNIFSTLRSALAVPLVGSSGIIGVLSFYHEVRDAYMNDHLRLAESIAPRLALSIERELRSIDETPAEEAESQAVAAMRYIDSELSRAKRMNTSVAVLICTLENWPEVATCLGRVEGERLLRSLVPMLRDSCREFDYVGRIRENEFLIVMPGLSSQALRAKAAKLMQISIDAGGQALNLLAADGEYPGDGAEADTLLAAADRRLFEMRFRRQAAGKSAARVAAHG
jgi:diguanylate cyclase (GGDEF)-like protein